MSVYLGLGSNLGDRRNHLDHALGRLTTLGLRDLRGSPVVESPAWLPDLAPSAWNRPFLNAVCRAEFDGDAKQLRKVCKAVEEEFDRDEASRWAPRAIDIDLIAVGESVTDIDGRRIPPEGLLKRSFVLTPLAYMEPGLVLPGGGALTALEHLLDAESTIPLWMGIINVTPDSFSDGGEYQRWEQISERINEMVAAGVHIIDIGAESTRPGATPITPAVEWQRLEPVLRALDEKFKGKVLRPLVSVDTRHAEVAAKALQFSVDIINDVSGLSSDAMMSLAADSDACWVAMHHLSVPAELDLTIDADTHVGDAVEAWLVKAATRWDARGIDRSRVIFDPGIGFGKSSIQSLRLMRNVQRFREHGFRVLVGHSRKSFMRAFSDPDPHERDLQTIASSLQLCQQGVDILRVHDVAGHARAYLAWAHLNVGQADST